MKHLLKILCIAGLPLIITAQDNDMGKADKDDNVKIGLIEYADCFTSFNNWDTDLDFYLSADEFYRAQFSVIDQNSNGKIDGDEWRSLRAYEAFYNRDTTQVSDASMFVFEDTTGTIIIISDSERLMNLNKPWDFNSDGSLSYDEFEAMAREIDALSVWDFDQDGMLSENEVINASFSIWDINRNGFIDPEEFTSRDQVCSPEISVND